MRDAKIKKLLNTEAVVDFTGTSEGLSEFATTTNATGSALTLEKFQEAMDYLGSDEYHQKEIERERMWAKGSEIINKALIQKIITPEEYMRLSMTLSINGILTVSPEMYKRLEKVK